MRTQDLNDDHLLQQGIIHLPRDIFSPCAETLFASICYFRQKEPNKPIKLFCCCDGGSADESLAIVNFIRMDGNIEGHLIGSCTSGGTVIWAACQKRYIYPNTQIGIHPAAWELKEITLTAAITYSMFLNFRSVDRAMCHIYAAASNQPFSWWWKMLNRPGDFKWLNPAKLLELQMGEMATQS